MLVREAVQERMKERVFFVGYAKCDMIVHYVKVRKEIYLKGRGRDSSDSLKSTFLLQRAD